MKKLGDAGMTMVEILIVSAIMGAAALFMLEMFKGQQTQTAKIELLYKSEQLRSVLGNQFLDDSNMCKCLFDGAANFPSTGTANLSGVNPTSIGRYNFVVPGDCFTAAVGKVFIDFNGIDNLELMSVELRDIIPISGSYFGELQVKLKSSKAVTGVNQQFLKFPVRVNTQSAGAGMESFRGCSLNGSSGGSGFVDESLTANGFIEFPNGLIMQWGQGTANGNSTTTISFNKPFTTQAYSVVVSGSNASSNNAQDNAPAVYNHPALTTLNNFRVRSARDENTRISWWAIGK